MGRKGWQDWSVVPDDGKGRCQSRVQSGYWRGEPCGNTAQFRAGKEICCQAHIAQALDRNPGENPEPIHG